MFWKITGLDYIDNKYVVSVGTNILINLLLQSTLWFSVMLFIRNTDRERVNGIKPLTYFLIPLIFTFQFIGEGDFFMEKLVKTFQILYQRKIILSYAYS